MDSCLAAMDSEYQTTADEVISPQGDTSIDQNPGDIVHQTLYIIIEYILKLIKHYQA
jgi:hypothetical protein